MRYACLALVGTLGALAFSNPPMVGYITYLPGLATEYTAIDRAGHLYFAGVTGSACSLPALSPQAEDNVYGSVSKLQPGGDGLGWTACLPGKVGGLALDTTGSIYVANNRNGASFITKLTPEASKVIYSTSIPAALASSLTVDRFGNAYITGTAKPGLPTTPGAYVPNLNCDAANSTCTGGFLVKLSQTGAIQYATYDWRPANAVAVNSRGEAWVTGTGDTIYGSGSFVAKFGSSGQLLFSTGFGGGLRAFQANTYGAGLGIAIDAKDAAYSVGYATLPVPTTPGTIQPGNPDRTRRAYIVKFDDVGNVEYGTYLGSVYDSISAVAVDTAGRAYVGLNGSAPGAVPANCGGSFLASTLLILNADASGIEASWAVAGRSLAISQDDKGGVYAAGTTGTSAFLVTPGAYLRQYPFGAMGSGFAAKFDVSQPASPAMTCLVNAASWWAGRNKYAFDGSVAPGEVVTLFGRGFRPGSNLRVTFDREPAPILYADSAQINAVVPFKTGQSSPFTLVSIHNGDQEVGPYQLPVSAAAPGVFGNITGSMSMAMSGNAVAAALNEDGSINSSANPARPGSVISIFTTGAGAYRQEIGDGTLGPMQPPFPTPVLGVGVWIVPPSTYLSERRAEVLFAGQAPGLIAGVVQVNVRIPDDAPPGATGIAVSFGDYRSTYPSIFVGNR